MSKLTRKDLHTPFSNLTLSKIYGHIEKSWFNQAPAAATAALSPLSGNNPWPNDVAKIGSLTFLSAKAAAVGESMTVDVQVTRAATGVTASILTAPFVFNNTQPAGVQISLPVNTALAVLNPGDVVQTSYTYVAGGTPAMTASRVQCDAVAGS